MLLADRTDEHRELFEEGTEAEYFGDEQELVDKLRFYITHAAVRERIAIKGHERCLRGKYAYIYRCAAVIAQIQAHE
jgi:spore maturation protein CgeB